MKRLLTISGALLVLSVLTESCASKVSRPPVHPRPPRKFVNAPQPTPAAPVVEKIG